jgi:tripartite-type tricarboxylate transporter receptor subunit TctC
MKSMNYWRALGAGAVFCAVMAGAGAGHAQDFPVKNITVIVPFPPGGINDAAIRILQPDLERRLGKSIIIDNRSGAGGAIGTQAVVRAAPDGYTLLAVASSHAVAPAVNPNLSYDTVKDLAPVVMIARDPMLFLVNSKVPAKDLREFVALAKSKPGVLNYSSPGFGTQTQFITELFKSKAGVQIQHVPFRGGAPALQAVIAGEVDFSVLSGQVSLPHIESGSIRAIALGGAARDPRVPNAPTVAEEGFKDVEAIQWIGLLVPAKTPETIIARLNSVVNEALADKNIRDKLAIQGMTGLGGKPEILGTAIESEVKLWKEIARTTSMKLAE